MLTWENETRSALYVSGDTVWYEGVAEVADRFDVGVAVLNLGAARIDIIGPIDLTMNATGAVETANTFSKAAIVPAHYEGWAHFSETQADVSRLFYKDWFGKSAAMASAGRFNRDWVLIGFGLLSIPLSFQNVYVGGRVIRLSAYPFNHSL